MRGGRRKNTCCVTDAEMCSQDGMRRGALTGAGGVRTLTVTLTKNDTIDMYATAFRRYYWGACSFESDARHAANAIMHGAGGFWQTQLLSYSNTHHVGNAVR